MISTKQTGVNLSYSFLSLVNNPVIKRMKTGNKLGQKYVISCFIKDKTTKVISIIIAAEKEAF